MEFTVAVGPVAQLAFIDGDNWFNATKYSGDFFTEVPRVLLQDAGGNFVHFDNTSGVEVSISANSYDALIVSTDYVDTDNYRDYKKPFRWSNLLVQATQGMVTFNTLKITKPGLNYTLGFTLYEYSKYTDDFTKLNVTLISEKFHVAYSPPRKLLIRSPAADSWAGNQAFATQPIVQAADYSNNAILNDMTSVCHASVVQSLSVDNEVLVYTAYAAATAISDITMNVSSGVYGVGQVFDVSLHFNYSVWVYENEANWTETSPINTTNYIPYLILDVNSSSGEFVMAPLTGVSSETQVLTFRYQVLDGDLSGGDGNGLLNVLSLVIPNGTAVVDGNKNDIDMAISTPNLENDAPVLINTTTPGVLSVTLDATITSGEYGEGDRMYFEVTFSEAVAVLGTPYLRLSSNGFFPSASPTQSPTETPSIIPTPLPYGYNAAWPTISGRPTVMPTYSNAPSEIPTEWPSESPTEMPTVVNYTEMPTAVPSWNWNSSDMPTSYPSSFPTAYPTRDWSGDSGVAKYSHSSTDHKTLFFSYVISELEFTVAHTNLSITSDYIQFLSVQHTILRYSDHPSAPANITLHGVSLGADVTVNTDVPKLLSSYGVQTTHADGSYYPGEAIRLTVQFDKEVVWGAIDGRGTGIYLSIECGSRTSTTPYYGRAFVEALLADNVTLQFLYIVEANVNCTELEIIPGGGALVIEEQTAYIKRKTTTPTTNADVDTSSLYLNTTASLSLLGFTPTVVETSLLSINYTNGNADELYPGDTVLVGVQFSAPTIANCTNPVVVIAAKYYRDAVYVSGNGSTDFTFRYTVSVGDFSNSSVAYRHTPYALCPVAGCRWQSSCRFLANSTTPSLEVDLRLARDGTQAFWKYVSGVSIGNQTIIPVIPNRIKNTTVTHIECRQTSGEYPAGSVIEFDVTFSDIVELSLSSFTLPKMLLNIHGEKYATYSGVHGRVMSFTYVTDKNDSLPYREYLKPYNDTFSPIICRDRDNCTVLNQANIEVDLATFALTNTTIIPTGITLDSEIAKVLSVYSDKATSSYDDEEYTAGEVITIYVEVDKPVVVLGMDPRILMDVGVGQRYAVFDRAASTPTLLAFTFLVVEGDESQDLMYSDTTIDDHGGNVQIYRVADIPSIPMDLTLPDPTSIAEAGKVLKINTSSRPNVQAVVSLTASGIYYAGDEILLRVDFTKYVIAKGHSYITLNVGDHVSYAMYVGFETMGDTSDNITYAVSKQPSTPTKHLFYRYMVAVDDLSIDLSYVDAFSLRLGLTDVRDIGYIRQASSTALTLKPANLDLPLPVPGTSGSLLGDATILSIDGRAPYMLSIDFASPNGIYQVDEVIHINVTFNKPVVLVNGGNVNGTGIPTLLMETGEVDGIAFYVSGSGTNTLHFEYTPQPGHFSIDLDYHSEKRLFNSAVNAFQYNDAKIFAASLIPTVEALVWLNPPGGFLKGCDVGQWDTRDHLAETAFEGRYHYTDIGVNTRGLDYQVRYHSVNPDTGVVITEFQDIFTSFSSEFQLRPEEAIPDCQIAHSVDIYGDVAVLGAPGTNRSVNAIQTVTVAAARFDPQREIQIISTHIQPQPGIQTFHTSVGVGEDVGGTFSFTYQLDDGWFEGPTRPIPANTDEYMMQAILAFDLPSLGNVTIKREPYIYCACTNAFTWTLTFHDLNEGPFELLIIDNSLLTGCKLGDLYYPCSQGVVEGHSIVQNAANVGGTFTLEGSGIHAGKVTPPIPFDADVATMNAAVTGLGLFIYDIQMEPTKKNLGRAWLIEFDAYLDSYEIPLLIADGSGLTGGDTEIFTQEVKPGIHGPQGIAGYFQLEWRGNVTSPLPAKATADEVKTALEALPVINFVNVNRSLPSSERLGFEYEIEFFSVNVNTPNGYEVQYPYMQNAEPIIGHNSLIATNATLIIDVQYGFERDYRSYFKARQGTHGYGAGAVFIFQKHEEQWNQMATIYANDTKESNLFGSSVSLVGDVLLVGALGANLDGVPEKQALWCSATSGYFKLEFRGWSSNAISFNVTRDELMDAIVNVPYTFKHLFPIKSIEIEDWGEGALCDNNTAVITFYSPTEGSTLLFDEDTRADIELLTIINLNLSTGDNSIISSFANYSNYTTYNNYTNYTNSSPTPTPTATPTATPTFIPTASPTANISFVISIMEIQKGTRKADGANADIQQIGGAYIFRAVTTCKDVLLNVSFNCEKKQWVQEAKLYPTKLPVNSRFGHAVAQNGQVAVVGAPGSKNEQGYVYLFEYNTVDLAWEFLQLLPDPRLENGDHFGSSVAISGDGGTIVCGAPDVGYSTGQVFVYTRTTGAGTQFAAGQSLIPSTLTYPLYPGVRFGASLAIEDNTIVVSASEYDDITVYLGRSSGALPEHKSGAVFVFRRTSSTADFSYVQHLTPSNVRAYDRFGYKVGLDGNNLVVSSSEAFIGEFVQSKVAVEIKIQAKYNDPNPLGGTFSIKWLDSNFTTSNGQFTTRPIPFDAPAQKMKQILEEDMPSLGKVLVTRTNVNAFDGGYNWTVTFVDHTSHVHIFDFDTQELTGTNPTVTVAYVHPNQASLRGKMHLFHRDSFNEDFIEQMFLSPHVHQTIDRCGGSIAISGKHSLVGCPNRDLQYPGQNSGAGFIYDLDFLGVKFSSQTFAVDEQTNQYMMESRSVLPPTEYPKAKVLVERETSSSGIMGGEDIEFYIRTVERNANKKTQTFLQHLYGINGGSLTYPETKIDHIEIFGDAVARSQYYGSAHHKASQWVHGMYDYRGISDYVPVRNPHIFVPEDTSQYDEVSITPDSIFEVPDETFVLVIETPGAWPSFQGRYLTTVTIEDDGDGITSDFDVSTAQYRKVYDTEAEAGAAMGEAVAVNYELGVMFTGAPSATVDDYAAAGKLLFYRHESNGDWVQQGAFSSPSPAVGGRYGVSVAVTKDFDRKVSVMAVGESHYNKVHIYISVATSVYALGESYVYETTLTAPEVTTTTQGFGESMALHGSMLVVGAPGLEKVYVFHRLYNDTTGAWYWTEGLSLQSSDYDYDVKDHLVVLHRQEFGRSISISDRSIIVGAPFADYNKLGSNLDRGYSLNEDWDTEGAGIRAFAKGKAYVFYSTPAEQDIRLFAPEVLTAGQFSVQYTHHGVTETTGCLQYDISKGEMEAALMGLSNIYKVTVELRIPDQAAPVRNEDGFFEHAWVVSFITDWQEPGHLTPLWHNNGADNCTAFDFLYNSSLYGAATMKEINATRVAPLGAITEIHTISASEGRAGDRFGWSVAIDENQIVVGAPHSSAVTTTSWDFETGTLLGWYKTGDAFDYQPTYGDNSRLHPVYTHDTGPAGFQTRSNKMSQSSGLDGLYFIGTYEKRPGYAGDYKVPDPSFPGGSYQGDPPTGTLVSHKFIIYGSSIDFKIGGGCDIAHVYVELLVDGMPIARSTGKCSEKMTPARFDVSPYYSRAAAIRIVDNSTSTWGHINVDNFRFDWDVAGPSITASSQKSMASGKVETPRSGAAYTYKQQLRDNEHIICPAGSKINCQWKEELKLIASDKRRDALFGTSVAVNDTHGVIAVGSPGASFTGFYKEVPSVYPYKNRSDDVSNAVGIAAFPIPPANKKYIGSYPNYIIENDGTPDVWLEEEVQAVYHDARVHEHCGAVYVYSKHHEMNSHEGRISQQQTWDAIEHSKVQPPDSVSQDWFGQDIAISDGFLAIGSSGQDGRAVDGGSVYLYSLEFSAVYMAQAEFYAYEGEENFIAITVLRDTDVYDGQLVLEYATSDLTARGVDHDKYVS